MPTTLTANPHSFGPKQQPLPAYTSECTAWVPRASLDLMALGLLPDAAPLGAASSAIDYALEEMAASDGFDQFTLTREGVKCYALTGFDLAEITQLVRRWWRANKPQ